MSEKFTGIKARCPKCNALVTVTITKIQAKALYKSFKGSYN